MIPNATEIIPRLWIGDHRILKSPKLDKFDFIVNVTRDLPILNTHTYRIPVNDNLEEEELRALYTHLKIILPKIHQYRLQLKQVLIHCYAGKQRSATIVIAYLMKYANMSLDGAIKSIQSKRPIVCTPYVNFKPILEEYQTYLKFN